MPASAALSNRATLEAKPNRYRLLMCHGSRRLFVHPPPSLNVLQVRHWLITFSQFPSSPAVWLSDPHYPPIAGWIKFPIPRQNCQLVRITIAFGSGIEWVRVINSRSNTPTSKRPESAMVLRGAIFSSSHNFRRKILAVKAVA